MAVPGFQAAPGGSASGNGGTLGADGWVTAPDGTQYLASQLNAPASQSTGPLPGYGSVPATGQGTTFSPYSAPQNPALDPSLVAPFNPSGDYAAQFHASIGSQRQALDNALATSLAQLGGRRDAAAKVIAGIPGQVQGEFKAANARAANVKGNADKAEGVGRANGGKGGDLNAGLYAQDLNQNEAASTAVTPLLQLGATANYDLGASGLQQQHLAGVSALEQQQAAFDQQMAGQQSQEAFQHNEGTLNYERGLATTPAPQTPEQQVAIYQAEHGVPLTPEQQVAVYQAEHPQNNDANNRSNNAADAAAVGKGYTSADGQAKATQVGSYLVQVLHSGVDSQHAIPGKQTGKLDDATKSWVIQQLTNNPDLGNYMSQFGYSPDAIKKL